MLKKKGEIVVAMSSADEIPFHMLSKESELIGLDVEIAKEIARLLEVKLRIDRSAKTYDDVVDVVAEDKADIAISTLSFTPQRALKVLFTEPYFTLSKAAVINRVSIAKAGTESLLELLTPSDKEASYGKPQHILHLPTKSKPIIGVVKGSAYERFARVTFPKTEIVAVETWKELIDQVSQGKLTAIFSDSNDIKLLVYQNPDITIQVLPVALKEPDYLYIAYSKKFSSLPHWIDLMIKNNPDFNLTYDQLFEKYKSEIKQGR